MCASRNNIATETLTAETEKFELLPNDDVCTKKRLFSLLRLKLVRACMVDDLWQSKMMTKEWRCPDIQWSANQMRGKWRRNEWGWQIHLTNNILIRISHARPVVLLALKQYTLHATHVRDYPSVSNLFATFLCLFAIRKLSTLFTPNSA